MADGENLVGGAPDDQDGHVEGGEVEVRGVVAGEHRGEGAVDDPGVLLGGADEVAREEGRDAGWVRREERREGVELGDVGGGEEVGVPGGESGCAVDDAEAGGVDEDELVDVVGMLDGDELSDPAAHGPADEIGLAEVEGVEEAEEHGGLVGGGVGELDGVVAVAEADEVDHVDAVAGAGEGGIDALPVFGVASEAVDEDDGLAVGGADDVVVDADGLRCAGGGHGENDVAAAASCDEEAGVSVAVVEADGAEVEADGGRDKKEAERK